MIPGPEKPSILDIPLKRWFPLNLETLLVILLVVTALVSRFYDLGARAISHDETNHYVPAYSLYSGNGYQYDPMTHGPLQFHMMALSFSLFGDSDFTGREMLIVMLHVFRVIGTRVVVAAPESLAAQLVTTATFIDIRSLKSSLLSEVDLSVTISDAEYQDKLKKYQERIREIEYIIYKKQMPVLIALEGWDAAGKGGAIRRLTQNMDPRGYTVIPVAAPNDEENSHHYLWRFWRVMPKQGHIAIFDRSWYGRVLVERVEGYCSKQEWQRGYREINEMEEQWVHYGAVLVKLWLQIDKDEQKRRFEERLANLATQWKITGEDWRNREKWAQYETANPTTLPPSSRFSRLSRGV